MLLASKFGEPWGGGPREAYFAYLREHPGDYLARLVALDMTESMTDAEVEEVFREALVASPEPAVVYLLYAVDRGKRGLWDAAEEAVRQGLERHPASATLHATLGRTLLERGDPGAATAELRRALELDPALVPARADLAVAAHTLGDEAAAAAASARVRAPDAPAGELAAFALRVGAALEGLGRIDEAAALYAEARARSAAEGRWGDVIELDMSRAMLLLGDRRFDRVDAVLAEGGAALAAPELAPELRQRFSTLLLMASTELSALRGDLDEARASRDRFAAVPGVFAGDVAKLDATLALARGAPEVPPRDPSAPCPERLSGAILAVIAKAPDAVGRLRAELADTGRCGAVGGPRRTRAEALVTLAEALAPVDPDGARAALQGFRAAQPSADAGSWLARRAAAVRL